jgi:hypothetical protein
MSVEFKIALLLGFITGVVFTFFIIWLHDDCGWWKHV